MGRPIYTETAAPAGLEDLVLNAWRFEVPASLAEPLDHEIPPDGCTSLAWVGAAVIVLGPRLDAHAVRMPPGAVVEGVRLWPDASRAVLGVPADRLRGIAAPAPVVAPGALLRPEAPGVVVPLAPAALDPLVRTLVRVVVAHGGQAPLATLAGTVGRSERQVQRRFRAAVGLTVKEFSRIRRFREAARHLLDAAPQPWGQVAYETGYADQAHLSREFSAIVGRAPESFRRWIGGLEHRGVRP